MVPIKIKIKKKKKTIALWRTTQEYGKRTGTKQSTYHIYIYIYIYINHGTIFLLFSTSLEIMCPQNQYYAFLFDNKILFSHS